MVGLVTGSPRLTLFDVLLEWRLRLEGLGADLAPVGSGIGMRGQMVLEAGHLAEGLGADVAHEGLVAGVDAHVLAQDVLGLDGLVADFAGVLGAAAAAVDAAEVAAVQGARVG